MRDKLSSHEQTGAAYLDFDIEISAAAGQEYNIAVLHSPAGEARQTIRFPYDEAALQSRLQDLRIALLQSGGTHRQALSPEEQTVYTFGRELFETVFSGEVRSRFDLSQREARDRGKGLRIKLRLPEPELAMLPWEFLYDPRLGEYICLSRDTPIVRYLDLAQVIRPLAVTPPLHILGMVASPKDLPALDVAFEKQRIETALKGLQGSELARLTWLEGQTWRDLQRAMRTGLWHIFHFIGHGGFDRHADEGVVGLADENGALHRFRATELGRLLADHHSLRLVILNSCEGARGSPRDVFSSTASILLRRGIPAVLAMQYPVTDRSAIEFARTFYETLADGLPVDAAVAEARKAVSLSVTGTLEWGAPALYLRAPQGVIFQLPEGKPTSHPELEEQPATDAQTEQRLEQFYTAGLGAFWVEDWDTACQNFQAILEIQPDNTEAAARLAQTRKQKKLHALYTQAKAAQEKKDWAAALSALETLTVDDPDFKDAADLLETARQQKQLADLYTEARRLSRAGQWNAVEKILARLAAMDPSYPDLEGLQAQAQSQLSQQKRQAQPPAIPAQPLQATQKAPSAAARPQQSTHKLPTWIIAAAGLVGLVVLLAIGVYLFGRANRGAPTPTGPAAVATVYDDFDNPAFDGSYNQNLWRNEYDNSQVRVTQSDGTLIFTLLAGEESSRGVALVARQFDGFTPTQPTFFEARLKVNGESEGTAALILQSGAGGAEFFTSCYPLSKGDTHAITCYWYQKGGEEKVISRVDVAPGAWHIVRIEVDPATMIFDYFADGVRVASQTPQNIDAFRETRFALAIDSTSESTNHASTTFDYVHFGPVSK